MGYFVHLSMPLDHNHCLYTTDVGKTLRLEAVDS